MNGLSLFSGIGGIDVALSGYVKPIAYCEIDPYCQGVLLSNMSRLSIATAPIWDDVVKLDGNQFRGSVDIIYGGFPCQNISIAGDGKGLEGKRSGLFSEIKRLCGEIKPRFVFLENVPAITSRGGKEVVRQLTSMGYDCRWCIICAESCGFKHKRKRWFLLGYSNSERSQEAGRSLRQEQKKPEHRGTNQYTLGDNWKEDEPEMVGVVNGLSNRVDRIKCLGNSVVPKQAKKAFEMLMGIKQKTY